MTIPKSANRIFVPLTLIWCVAVWYITSRENVPLDVIVATATGTLGPIALITSMAAAWTGWNPRFSGIARVLAVAFAVTSVLQLVNAGASGRLNLQWFQFDLSVFVLFSLLPLLGCLHLTHLLQPAESNAKAA